METLILDGKKVANELLSKLPNGNGKELVIITIGDDDASKVYVRNKIKDAERVGLKGVNYRFNPEDYNLNLKHTTDLDLFVNIIMNKISELNVNPNVVGIMIQQPYPSKLKKYHLEDYILTSLDVDGLNVFNISQTLLGRKSVHYPATPKGIIKLLDYYNISIEGKNVVIIGRSDIVGKPLAAMMTARNSTVTLCHSKTDNLRLHLAGADIIISAAGKPKFIKAEMLGSYDLIHNYNAGKTFSLKPVIIDVGMNRDENGKLCGDVDFDDVYPYCSAITPVPGGVGPMTRWGLIDNCCKNN